ncbi:hypothetical protein [Mesorhizobium sp. Mes31]|uniref:COG3904 family protein n=1 Tax=Mesorhizobium sp. Mes31 TaxID=2926017 RepID=UPI00211958F9|nr:hypothetical protein [Mesorhizobium sp. Mes31]
MAFAEETLTNLGPPMQFGIVRSNAPGCEPICPEWISAQGSIEAGTPVLFKRFLKTLDGRKLPIIVNSPGGSVDAALQLGRMIRKNKFEIAVGMTTFTGCPPGMDLCQPGEGATYFGIASDSGAMCNSACPLMFAGGIRRLAGGQAYVGVHQITTTYFPTKRQYRTTYRTVRGKKYRYTTEYIIQGDSYKVYTMSKSLERRLACYLSEMGVEKGVLLTMKNTPASAIHQLELQNMLRMKLVTSGDYSGLLTLASICRANPMPENCRVIMSPTDKAKPVANVAETKPSSSGSESPSGGFESRLMLCPDTDGKSKLIAVALGEACPTPRGAESWPVWSGGTVGRPYSLMNMKP